MIHKNKKTKFKNIKDRNYINKTNLILVILSVVLIIVFYIGSMKDKQLREENNQEYDKWKEKVKIEKNLSLYEKVKKGKEINLLVIGDSIGLSTGKTSENGDWIKLLNKWLEKKYKCNANIINLSYDKGNIQEGLDKVMENGSKKYDLAITLFGEKNNNNLKVEEFATLYERIIKKLYNEKKCDIIPVVQHSLNKENSYSNVIKKLSNHYKLSVANVENGFLKSQVPYKKLVNEANEPNNKGYEIYFNVIADTLNKNIEESKQVSNEEVKILYNNAISLE